MNLRFVPSHHGEWRIIVDDNAITSHEKVVAYLIETYGVGGQNRKYCWRRSTHIYVRCPKVMTMLTIALG